MYCVLFQILSIALSILVIVINIFFSLTYLISLNFDEWWFFLICFIIGSGYLSFCAYLALDMIINMGGGTKIVAIKYILALMVIIAIFQVDTWHNSNL